MTQEEIKSKLALTPEQSQLLNRLNLTLMEMRKKCVGFVFDGNLDSLSFSAFNNSYVLEIGEDGEINQTESEDINDILEWGNVFASVQYVDSYYGNIRAIFGEKSDVNESMMSAAL